jgi:hypothetical protein
VLSAECGRVEVVGNGLALLYLALGVAEPRRGLEEGLLDILVDFQAGIGHISQIF